MREYEVQIGGLPHTVRLSDADAKARGLTPRQEPKRQEKQAPEPKNKARSASTKGAE